MIFILGGNGFVGSAISRYCQKKNHPYKIITKENYNQLIGHSCDVFINANGNSKKFLAKEDPKNEFQLSVTSVRSSLVDFHFDKYVYFSSCDIYADCSTTGNTSEESPINPSKQSPYGFHKGLAELCVQHAAKNWLIIRFGGFVGPGLKKNPIYDIMNKGPLWLHPESKLQFLNSDNAAEIVFQLIERCKLNEIVNVCGDGVIELQTIIDSLGVEVVVKEGSPIVDYNVKIEKLKSFVPVPPTKQAVMQFIQQHYTTGELE